MNWRRRCAAGITALAIALNGGGPAAADPALEFEGSDLGAPNSLTVFRPTGFRKVVLPVPDGLSPSEIQADIVVPSEVQSARVTLSVDGVQVLSETIAGGQTEPVRVDIDSDAAEVGLRFAATEISHRACTAHQVAPVVATLENLRLGFDGVPATPDSVGRFFPGRLNNVVVVVPEQRTDAIEEAVLELAAQLTRRYDGQPVVSVLVDADAGPESSPFERTVVLRSADEPSVRVDDGVLIVEGGDLLPGLVRALFAPEVQLLSGDELTARAVGASSTVDEASLPQQWSIGQLGLGTTAVEGGIQLGLDVPLEQSRFGGAVERIDATIAGFVVSPGERPVVQLELNGTPLQRIELASDGSFSETVSLEGAQLGRENTLTVRSDIDLDCGDGLPLHQLRLSPETRVSVKRGQSLAPGLDRFPQVALAGLAVNPGDTVLELEAAANTVASMQQASTRPVNPRAVAIEDILTGNTAGLIVGGRGDRLASIDRLAYPLDGRVVVNGVEVDAGGPAAISMVQATEGANGQDLVVVHIDEANGSLLIDRLARNGWDLSGTAIAFNGSDPVALGDSPSGPASLGFVDSGRRSVLESFAIGLLGAVILFFGVGLAGRARRRLRS